MTKFYVTFGVNYAREPHPVLGFHPAMPDGYWELEADTEWAARMRVNEAIGNAYSSVYTEAEIAPDRRRWFPLGALPVDAWLVEARAKVEIEQAKIYYVSGPMTGLPEFNYPAFAAATTLLEGKGHMVLSPHSVGQHEGWEWEDYMKAAVQLQTECDAVYMLPGWSRSRGGRVEHGLATTFGQSINYAPGAEEEE